MCVSVLTFRFVYGLQTEPLTLGVRDRIENCKNKIEKKKKKTQNVQKLACKIIKNLKKKHIFLLKISCNFKKYKRAHNLVYHFESHKKKFKKNPNQLQYRNQ